MNKKTEILILRHLNELSTHAGLRKETEEQITLLSKKTKIFKADTEEEQKNRINELTNSYDGNKTLLKTFIEAFAEKNKTKKISLTKYISILDEVMTFISKGEVSTISFDLAMQYCLKNDKINVNYAKKSSVGFQEKINLESKQTSASTNSVSKEDYFKGID